MEKIVEVIKSFELNEVSILLILIIIILLQEIVLWSSTHNFMGKKCEYDCEKCQDWSCQKTYCDYKRKELEKKDKKNKPN